MPVMLYYLPCHFYLPLFVSQVCLFLVHQLVCKHKLNINLLAALLHGVCICTLLALHPILGNMLYIVRSMYVVCYYHKLLLANMLVGLQTTLYTFALCLVVCYFLAYNLYVCYIACKQTLNAVVRIQGLCLGLLLPCQYCLYCVYCRHNICYCNYKHCVR